MMALVVAFQTRCSIIESRGICGDSHMDQVTIEGLKHGEIALRPLSV